MDSTVIAFIASVLAIVVGLALYRRVLAAPTSTDKANEIAAAIAAGAQAFLSRQYRTVAVVGVPIFLIGSLIFALGKLVRPGLRRWAPSRAPPPASSA